MTQDDGNMQGSTNGAILSARGLVKGYGRPPVRQDVLHGLDLTVRAGEFVAIMGPSGCGKTTLLNLLGLMSRPDAGTLHILDRNVGAAPPATRAAVRREYLGFVFQRLNLLPTVNALDNVAVSLRVRGRPARKREILELLDRMGVAHVARRKSGRMSIGEQQRVAVARALAHRPSILLADEPTGSLDTAHAEALGRMFAEAHRGGQTIVMITHSSEAAAWAGRVCRMRDGRWVEGDD